MLIFKYINMARRKMAKRRRRRFKRRRRKGDRALTSNISRQVTRFRYVELFPIQTNSDASGVVSAAIQVHNFTDFFTPQSGTPATVLPVNEARLFQVPQFDLYKVTYIKLQYILMMNRTGIPTLGEDGNVPALIVCYDPDNTGFPSSVQSLLTRDHSKMFSLLDEWEYKIRIPDTQLPGQVELYRGYHNTQSQARNNAGVIWMQTNGAIRNGSTAVAANTFIGQLKATVYVSWKGRQYNKIGMEDPTLAETEYVLGTHVPQRATYDDPIP